MVPTQYWGDGGPVGSCYYSNNIAFGKASRGVRSIEDYLGVSYPAFLCCFVIIYLSAQSRAGAMFTLGEHIMENVALSAAVSKAVSAAIQSQESAGKKWVAVVDQCKAEGITPDSLAPKGQHREPMKAVIVGAFSKAEQELLAKLPATLSEGEKIERRTLQQKVGMYVNYIQKKLKPKQTTGASHRRTLVERLSDEWKAQITAIENAQKGESDLAFDGDIVIKTLRELIADI